MISSARASPLAAAQRVNRHERFIGILCCCDLCRAGTVRRESGARPACWSKVAGVEDPRLAWQSGVPHHLHR